MAWPILAWGTRIFNKGFYRNTTHLPSPRSKSLPLTLYFNTRLWKEKPAWAPLGVYPTKLKSPRSLLMKQRSRKEVKDRPARTPNVVFMVGTHYISSFQRRGSRINTDRFHKWKPPASSYILALTSMLFRLIQWFNMIGGLLKNIFSRGWFSIRFLFAISIFSRFCTAMCNM